MVEENVFTLDEEPVGPEVVSFLQGLADGSSRIIVDLCQNAGDMRRIPVKPVPSVADLGCDILFQREAVSGYRRYETRLIIVSWTVSRGFFRRNGTFETRVTEFHRSKLHYHSLRRFCEQA